MKSLGTITRPRSCSKCRWTLPEQFTGMVSDFGCPVCFLRSTGFVVLTHQQFNLMHTNMLPHKSTSTVVRKAIFKMIDLARKGKL